MAKIFFNGKAEFMEALECLRFLFKEVYGDEVRVVVDKYNKVVERAITKREGATNITVNVKEGLVSMST